MAAPEPPAADLLDRVGDELGVSAWMAVDQSMIDRFAEATRDRQAIHCDPVAARETPFGGTIAHGFLTLSLLTAMIQDAGGLPSTVRMGINHGLDEVRFVAPVPSGSRIRGRFTLDAAERRGGRRLYLVYRVAVEVEGRHRPALTGKWSSIILL
jgi:acyl dehydratase